MQYFVVVVVVQTQNKNVKAIHSGMGKKWATGRENQNHGKRLGREKKQRERKKAKSPR
jgi:hypothetical protein